MSRWTLYFLILPAMVHADITQRLNIATVDGTTCNTYPYKAIFANTACTDNGNGTVSITSSGGGPATLPLPPGDTNYIQNTSSLQSGANFYVSSGTVSGQLKLLTGTTFYQNGNVAMGGPLALGGTYLGSLGDFSVSRNGGASGAIYFGTSGGAYIYYDGSASYTFAGGGAAFNGLLEVTGSLSEIDIHRRDTSGAAYILYSSAGELQFYNATIGEVGYFDVSNGGLHVIAPGNITSTYGVTAATGTFTTSVTAGTTAGSGTQLYRCAGGTDAGWILYGNSGAAQTLCAGGGGSLTAISVYVP